jgi:hypothetical protein
MSSRLCKTYLCDVIPPTHPPVLFLLFFLYDGHLDRDASGFCQDLNHYDYGMEQLGLPETLMHKQVHLNTQHVQVSISSTFHMKLKKL